MTLPGPTAGFDSPAYPTFSVSSAKQKMQSSTAGISIDLRRLDRIEDRPTVRCFGKGKASLLANTVRIRSAGRWHVFTVKLFPDTDLSRNKGLVTDLLRHFRTRRIARSIADFAFRIRIKNILPISHETEGHECLIVACRNFIEIDPQLLLAFAGMPECFLRFDYCEDLADGWNKQ